jgi:hypothetical protein
VSRPELQDILSKHRGLSAPRALLDMQLIDEDQFLDIWARFSRLKPEIITPEDISPDSLEGWSEIQAVRYHAMPSTTGEDGALAFAFTEPPSEEVIQAVAEIAGAPIEARLLRPSNLSTLRNIIYPARLLDGQPRHPLNDDFQALSENDRRRVREFQMTRSRTQADAMISLRLISPEKVRRLVAGDLGVTEADFSRLTISVSLIKALGAVFCEVHGLIPLSNGTIAITNPIHPASVSRIREILGSEVSFCADTPPAFAKIHHDLAALRFGEDSLIEYFVDAGELTREHAVRIRDMRRLISGPVDRLLIQLGLVKQPKVLKALRAISGLATANGIDKPAGLEAEELLSPGFSQRTGVAVHQIRDSGITFRISGLLSETDLHEITERCAGMPLEFQLSSV